MHSHSKCYNSPLARVHSLHHSLPMLILQFHVCLHHPATALHEAAMAIAPVVSSTAVPALHCPVAKTEITEASVWIPFRQAKKRKTYGCNTLCSSKKKHVQMFSRLQIHMNACWRAYRLCSLCMTSLAVVFLGQAVVKYTDVTGKMKGMWSTGGVFLSVNFRPGILLKNSWGGTPPAFFLERKKKHPWLSPDLFAV